MIDEGSMDYAFTPVSKEPPAGSSETWVSEMMDEMRGWLRRRPIGKANNWEWSFCTVSDGRFKYFDQESQLCPSGVFNFRQLSGTIETKKEKQFIMEFHSCDHQFLFKARSRSERQMWLTSLNTNFALFSPMDCVVNSVSIQERFWRYEKISNLKFVSLVKTGDILLFQAKNVGAKIQRGIARSAFDHAAMVFVDENEKILVFEATQADGVAFAYWEDFLQKGWIDMYNRIILRRLEIENPERYYQDFNRFMTETQGKKFGFSAMKIISKNKKKPGQQDDFFCSELLAAAYKSVGLLPEECDPSKVWPGDFGKDGGLKLKTGRLGPMLEIDFTLRSLDGV
jgi:hypothetical protein